MSAHIECPICMDDIDVTKNLITTECGHCFHASCVMRNVARNGFACPMCRTIMAEEPDEENSEVSGEEEEEEEEEEMFNDYALRGFRFFVNNIQGVEHHYQDELEEDLEGETTEEVQEFPAKPTIAFITEKLVEQGIYMEDLLKVLLRDHEEYDVEQEEFERVDNDVFGKIRIIISNYEPPEPHQPEEVVADPEPKVGQ